VGSFSASRRPLWPNGIAQRECRLGAERAGVPTNNDSNAIEFATYIYVIWLCGYQRHRPLIYVALSLLFLLRHLRAVIRYPDQARFQAGEQYVEYSLCLPGVPGPSDALSAKSQPAPYIWSRSTHVTMIKSRDIHKAARQPISSTYASSRTTAASTAVRRGEWSF